MRSDKIENKTTLISLLTIALLSGLLYFSFNGRTLAEATLVQIVGNNQGGGSSISTSIGATTAGNLIVVCLSTASNLSTSITDNRSNTYTLATRGTYGAGSEVSIYYSYNTTGGVTSVVGTFAGWVNPSRMIVAEYSGVAATNPLDKVSNYNNGWNGGASWTSQATVSTTQADELLVGCAGDAYGTSATFGAGTDYTARRTEASLFFEDRIVASTGTYAATGSHNLASGYAIVAAVATFKIGGTPVDNPPNISSVASSTTDTAATITWTTDEAATSQVEYGLTTSYTASSTFEATTVTSHSVGLSNLSPLTLYHFRVISGDANGNFSTSSDYTFTTTAEPDIIDPSVPQSLGATAVSSSQINLSWSASTDTGGSGLAGYDIYRNDYLIASTSQISYSDTGLTASTLYNYYVTAFDGSANVSASSSIASATTEALSSATGTPIIFFTDLTSGPKTGGENNDGVFVTIYGNYFGDNPTVTVGGGQVARIKSAPSSYMWYQKMTVQLGSAAQTGNIAVTTSAGTSNGIPFTVRNGNIYFVSTTGSNSNNGSFAAPWQTLLYARDHISAGDTVYAMDGVGQTANDGQGWNTSFLVREGGTSGAGPVAFVGYPGATVTLGNVSGTPAFGVRSHTSAPGYIVFANLTLTGMSGLVTSGPTAPATPSSNWRIVGNDITCPNGDGESGCLATQNSSYVYLYGNNVHDAGIVTASSHYHGVYISTDTNHVWMGWNTVSDIRGCRGIQVHSSALGSGGPSDPTGHNLYDLHFFNNKIYDTQCDGIILATVDPSQGTVEVYNNLIYNAGTGPSNPENTGAWNCVNVDDMTSGGLPGSGTVEVYNNTMYNCGSFATPPYSNANGAVMNGGNNASLYIRLRNNLIYQLSAPYLVIYTSNSLINGSYNLFYGQGAAPNQSYVTNSISADPLFADRAGGNFHLSDEGSPAYNAGTTIGALTFDFEGNTRPQSTVFDVGSYEYYSGTSVSDATAPTVTAFAIPTTASSLTVNITTFTATDDTAVTGYKITESASSPSFSDAGWTASAPSNYTFGSEGSKTLYAWAKDAAGNVSTSLSDSVVVTLPTYTVGGTVSGLGGSVILQNNAGDNLTISADGSFVFVSSMQSGASYAITVLNQPTGQTCTVSNGSGTVATSNITNVTITCENIVSSPVVISTGGGGGSGGGRRSISMISTITNSSVLPFLFTRNLVIGMSGTDVVELQKFLIKSNFLSATTSPLGFFGLVTRKAVMRFQCDHNIVCEGFEGLTGYGMMGPLTKSAINAELVIGFTKGKNLLDIINFLLQKVQHIQSQIEKLN